MDEKILQLKEIIDRSDNIVFFGGAGVSTESGVPDFRSVDGLYHQQYDYPPETILSHTFYQQNPDEFYRFYRNKMLFPQARPNNAHRALAELERMGKLKAVITQNIDGLHQAAGSREVYELHGTVHNNYCEKCRKKYSLEDILNSSGVPKCTCGGTIKPDVGTSLAVYPAAGLIDYFQGNHLVLINKSTTSKDARADLVIHDAIGQVLSQVVEL